MSDVGRCNKKWLPEVLPILVAVQSKLLNLVVIEITIKKETG